VLPPKSNNPVIGSNNINMRPISSNNNQKVVLNNPSSNIVNSIKKVVVPEQKKVGNQIKIAENLIKGNNYNYNYNNIKNNVQPQSNLLRPASGHKADPVKIGGNRYVIKK
jgi:hypothetical protein